MTRATRATVEGRAYLDLQQRARRDTRPFDEPLALYTLEGTGQFPAVAQMLLDAKADLTAFADFPQAHWRKIWSTHPLERLNREVKRRTDVVGIFPNPAALLRLSSCALIEAHDEWQDSDRRYGIVALTRRAPRDELHHSMGRDHQRSSHHRCRRQSR